MKEKYLSSALLLGVVFLTMGCAIIPGSHVSTYDKGGVDGEEKSARIEAVIHTITPELLRDLRLETQQPCTNPELDAKLARYDYHIGKGDILNIVVYDHEELTIPAGSYRSSSESGNWVKNDGTLYYPFVGNLYVEGMNIEEVRTLLAKKLAKYIERPHVDVKVAEFRSKSIYVTGEVNDPGKQFLTNIPMTLLDAINGAGGLTEDADWRHVTITHEGVTETVSVEALLQHGVLTENRLLEDNDIVHVKRNDDQMVFVLGDVNTPSTQLVGRKGLRLTNALADAGGINEDTADPTGVFVIRKSVVDGKKVDVFQLDLMDATALVLGTEFFLQPYDIVYVTSAPLARWNRVIELLLPTSQLYDYLNNNQVLN